MITRRSEQKEAERIAKAAEEEEKRRQTLFLRQTKAIHPNDILVDMSTKKIKLEQDSQVVVKQEVSVGEESEQHFAEAESGNVSVTEDSSAANVTKDVVVKEEDVEIRVVEEIPLEIEGDNMDWMSVDRDHQEGSKEVGVGDYGDSQEVKFENIEQGEHEDSAIPEAESSTTDGMVDEAETGQIPLDGGNAGGFSQILAFIFGTLGKHEVLVCRLVRKSWCKAIDEYFENSNYAIRFKTVEAFSLFSVAMENHSGNPFVGRSISLEPSNSYQFTSEMQDQFWSAAASFLQKYGNHIWFLCFANIDERYYLRLTQQEFFKVIPPNIQSLRITIKWSKLVYSFAFTDNDCPRLPNLHSLQLQRVTDIYHDLLHAYCGQLKKLELESGMFDYRSPPLPQLPNLTELHIRGFCGLDKALCTLHLESVSVAAPNLQKMTIEAISCINAKWLFRFLEPFQRLRALNVSFQCYCSVSNFCCYDDEHQLDFKIKESLVGPGPVILSKLESLKIDCSLPTATFMFLKSLPALKDLSLGYLCTDNVNEKDIVGRALKNIAGRRNMIQGRSTIWKLLPNLKTLTIGKLKFQRGMFFENHNKLEKTQKLFEDVLPLLYKHMGVKTALKCREICRKWRDGVDAFVQTRSCCQPFNETSYKTMESEWNYNTRIYSPLFVTFRTTECITKVLEQTKNWSRNPLVGRALWFVEGKTGLQDHYNFGGSDTDSEGESDTEVEYDTTVRKQTQVTREFLQSAGDESPETVKDDVWGKAVEFLKAHGEHVWYLRFSRSDYRVQDTFEFYKILQACLVHVPNLKSLQLCGHLRLRKPYSAYKKEFEAFVTANPFPKLTQLESLCLPLYNSTHPKSPIIKTLLFESYGKQLAALDISDWSKQYGPLPKLKELRLRSDHSFTKLAGTLFNFQDINLHKMDLYVSFDTPIDREHLFELLELFPHLRVLELRRFQNTRSYDFPIAHRPLNLPRLESLNYSIWSSSFDNFSFLRGLPNLRYLTIPDLETDRDEISKYGKFNIELRKCAFGSFAEARQSEIWDLLPKIKIITLENRKLSRCGYITQEPY